MLGRLRPALRPRRLCAQTTGAPREKPRIHVRTYQAEDGELFGPDGLEEASFAHEHDGSNCSWTGHPHKFSGGYANGVSEKFTLEDAKAKCIEMGATYGKCKAVTCINEEECTVRGSSSLGTYHPVTTHAPSGGCFTPQNANKPLVLGGKMYK